MKIILQHAPSDDLQVIIKGNSSNEKVKKLIDLISDIDTERISKSLIGKTDEKEYVLNIENITYFESESANVFAVSNGARYKLNSKLYELEQSYGAYGFRRISKSVILNLNYIKYLEVEFSGNYQIATRRNEKMTLSRRYVRSVKNYIKEEM